MLCFIYTTNACLSYRYICSIKFEDLSIQGVYTLPGGLHKRSEGPYSVPKIFLKIKSPRHQSTWAQNRRTRMLTQIVVLFMVTQLNMPTWCKNLMLVALGLNILRFLCGCFKGVYKAGKESA